MILMEMRTRGSLLFTKKKCFACGSLSHLIKDCDYYEKKMAREAEIKRVINTGNWMEKPAILLTGRTNINSVRPKVNAISSKVNTVRSRQPVHKGRPKACKGTVSIKEELNSLFHVQEHTSEDHVDRGLFDSGMLRHYDSGNKKKGVGPTREVSNSNPFDVLNENIENSSTSTTPIVDKIRKLEKLIIYGKVTLVNDDGKHVKKDDNLGDHDSEDEVESVENDMAHSMASERVGFGTKSLLEQWKDTYKNGDYDEDPYDDDMYEGQDFPVKIQDICDNLDIRVRGRRKK
ncbi:hypothetical protein Tco_0140041 [Tanacetum coccineum]